MGDIRPADDIYNNLWLVCFQHALPRASATLDYTAIRHADPRVHVSACSTACTNSASYSARAQLRAPTGPAVLATQRVH